LAFPERRRLEEGEDALWQLGGDEADDDGDEHGGRPGVLAVTVRLVASPGRAPRSNL